MFDLAATNTTAISKFWQPEPQISVSSAPPDIDYWLNSFSERRQSASLFLFEQQQLQNNLDELASLLDNWDGEGAVSISQSVLARTKSVMSWIITDSPAPELTPNSNGTISLEWESEKRFLYLEIGYQNFSVLLGGDGIPSKRFHEDGLPSKNMLSAFIATVTGIERSRDTSITVEKMIAA